MLYKPVLVPETSLSSFVSVKWNTLHQDGTGVVPSAELCAAFIALKRRFIPQCSQFIFAVVQMGWSMSGARYSISAPPWRSDNTSVVAAVCASVSASALSLSEVFTRKCNLLRLVINTDKTQRISACVDMAGRSRTVYLSRLLPQSCQSLPWAFHIAKGNTFQSVKSGGGGGGSWVWTVNLSALFVPDHKTPDSIVPVAAGVSKCQVLKYQIWFGFVILFL